MLGSPRLTQKKIRKTLQSITLKSPLRNLMDPATNLQTPLEKRKNAKAVKNAKVAKRRNPQKPNDFL